MEMKSVAARTAQGGTGLTLDYILARATRQTQCLVVIYADTDSTDFHEWINATPSG